MKETSYDYVKQKAEEILQDNHFALEFFLGREQAAQAAANVYWAYGNIAVCSQHYKPQTGNEYLKELTLITSTKVVSIIGTQHAHCYNTETGYVMFDDIEQDLLAIFSLIDFVLQQVL